MSNFKKTASGSYINLDLILEFGVIPFYDQGDLTYLIRYWDIKGDEQDLEGWYETEAEAQKALDKFVKI